MLYLLICREMKIAIETRLFTKGNMQVDSGHNFEQQTYSISDIPVDSNIFEARL